MLTDNQIAALRAPFPPEALSADTSRGFELTSIKAAYIIERLNQVFGLCGMGWRYVHSPFETQDQEVLVEVALQYRVVEHGFDPVVWDSHAYNWAFIADSGAWSWPIFAPGGRRPGKGTAPITDARKGAITDGLTKAASMIGVGHEVFKGLVRVGQASAPTRQQTPQKAPERAQKPQPSHESQGNSTGAQSGSEGPSAPTGEGSGTGFRQPNAQPGKSDGPQSQANSTTFWRLANGAGKVVDRAAASEVAKSAAQEEISWDEARAILEGLIADAQGNGQKEEAVAPARPSDDPLDELFA